MKLCHFSTPPPTRTGLVATLSCGRIICGRPYRVRALCSIWGQCLPQAGSAPLTPPSSHALPLLPWIQVTLPVFLLHPPPLIYHAGTLSGVLALHTRACSLKSWHHDTQISHDSHSTAPCCMHTHTHTHARSLTPVDKKQATTETTSYQIPYIYICKSKWRKK